GRPDRRPVSSNGRWLSSRWQAPWPRRGDPRSESHSGAPGIEGVGRVNSERTRFRGLADVTLAWIGFGLVALAFALGVTLCAVVRVVAPRVGLVDRPGGRQAQRAPTPPPR